MRQAYVGIEEAEQFRKRGVEVKLTDMSKSELYLDLLPVLNSRRCDLLDHDAILGQLVALERRTARTGRDTIDHAPHAHDDIANVVAGVVHLALKKPRPLPLDRVDHPTAWPEALMSPAWV